MVLRIQRATAFRTTGRPDIGRSREFARPGDSRGLQQLHLLCSRACVRSEAAILVLKLVSPRVLSEDVVTLVRPLH
jgi:hypothetical protein